VAQLFHTFPPSSLGPGGVTATVLLAESHLCLHTWPEQSAVTLDVYVCNFGGDHSAKAEMLLESLTSLLQPVQVQVSRMMRGKVDSELGP
jgi:S-adenosylmethionine decarboxylase